MQDTVNVSTDYSSLRYSHLFRQLFPFYRDGIDSMDVSQPTIIPNIVFDQGPVQISPSSIPDPPSYWKSFPQSAYQYNSSRNNFISLPNVTLNEKCSSLNERPPELQRALHELVISNKSEIINLNNSCIFSRTDQHQANLIPKNQYNFAYKNEAPSSRNCPCSSSHCRRNHDRRRSSIVIHQIADADDHFSKALNTSRYENSVQLIRAKNGQRNLGESTGTVFPLNGNGHSDLERFQNIADLVVEKHFEKALANFQPAPTTSPTPSLAESTSSLSKGPLDLSLRPHDVEERASSRESLSDNSCCSPLNCCSFNPKKKWMEKYVQVGDPYWSCVKSETEGSTRTGSCPVLCSRSEELVSYRNEREPMDIVEQKKRQEVSRSIDLTIDIDSPYYPSSSPASFSGSQTGVARSLKERLSPSGESLSLSDEDQPTSKRRSTSSLIRPCFCKFGYLGNIRFPRRADKDIPTPSTSPTCTSGIFTDSNYSIDATGPAVPEVDSSKNKQIGLNTLKKGDTTGRKQRSFRKRTASDVSGLYGIKRSRATDLIEVPHRLSMMELQQHHAIQEY